MPTALPKYKPLHARFKQPKKADPFYYTPAWQALRNRVLSEEKACAVCGEEGRQDDHVDHIKARKTHPWLSLVRSNLRRVHWSCHSSKTVREDGGFGRSMSA